MDVHAIAIRVGNEVQLPWLLPLQRHGGICCEPSHTYAGIFFFSPHRFALVSPPFVFDLCARRLAPIPQASLTPVAQAEEEVVAEAALEDEIVTIVDVAVRRTVLA